MAPFDVAPRGTVGILPTRAGRLEAGGPSEYVRYKATPLTKHWGWPPA